MSEWIPLEPPLPFRSEYIVVDEDVKEITDDRAGVGKALDSFSERGLAQPGVIVRCSDGEEFLLGRTNTLGGGCDDCAEIDKYSMVIAYRDCRALLGLGS